MSVVLEKEIKHWTALRKSALVLVVEIIHGRTIASAANPQFDLQWSEIESWVEDGKRGMKDAACAKPENVRKQYEHQFDNLQEAYGEVASISRLYRWFQVSQRTITYRSVKSAPGSLEMNKNTVQWIFQLMGWQARKRYVGMRPRIVALPSVPTAPNQHWTVIWGNRDGRLTLAMMIDCRTSKLIGWQLSRTSRAIKASAPLEQALITRFSTLDRVPDSFLLRADKGLVLSSDHYTWLVRSCYVKRLITRRCLQQSNMIERDIRTLESNANTAIASRSCNLRCR
ncbi:hypothetical protein [Xanthomonas arboricola]|uniref:hypothetical protein n=1 Tax=Xanthomonas arboricola TaxID=56448 RepID=UPI001FD20F71|nr:hypothetical protein [Xanthomonas arboricola]